MKQETKKRVRRTLVISLTAALIGMSFGLYQVQNQSANKGAQVVNKGSRPIEGVAGAQLGGTFSLTDHTGKAVTEAHYADGYKIVYFGFTFCPMICPTELQKIAKVLETLGEAGDGIRPLLISVDPERDTPEVMAQYVEQFHPRLVGLTGTPEQTKSAEDSFKVFAKKVQDENMSEYTMDHSSYIYLMSPDNTLVAIYGTKDTADSIAADIREKLSL